MPPHRSGSDAPPQMQMHGYTSVAAPGSSRPHPQQHQQQQQHFGSESPGGGRGGGGGGGDDDSMEMRTGEIKSQRACVSCRRSKVRRVGCRAEGAGQALRQVRNEGACMGSRKQEQEQEQKQTEAQGGRYAATAQLARVCALILLHLLLRSLLTHLSPPRRSSASTPARRRVVGVPTRGKSASSACAPTTRRGVKRRTTRCRAWRLPWRVCCIALPLDRRVEAAC